MDVTLTANDWPCQGYNVRSIVDRAGAIVERYAYDGYGRPYIRESAGRGDMNNDTLIGSGDVSRFADAATGVLDSRSPRRLFDLRGNDGERWRSDGGKNLAFVLDRADEQPFKKKHKIRVTRTGQPRLGC